MCFVIDVLESAPSRPIRDAAIKGRGTLDKGNWVRKSASLIPAPVFPLVSLIKGVYGNGGSSRARTLCTN